MKEFLQKQFLFDKSYGMMPYFWMIALLFFSFQIVGEVKGIPQKWGVVALLLIYAKFYHDSYGPTRFQTPRLIIQLVICIIVAMLSQYGTLYIFTAWQIGSMRLTKKTFNIYVTMYLVVTLSGLGLSTYLVPDMHIYDILISLFFAIGSPFAAKSLRNSYLRRNQLSQSNQRLETLVRQSERGRIAKDLHDNLGQSFSLITLKAELAEKLMLKDHDKAAKELQDIAETSRQDLSLVREIVANLNKQTIAEAMIIEERNLQTAKIFISSKNEDISAQWPDQIQNVLAAVIKEAVTNIIRYSHASQADFIFSDENNQYALIIKDNGVGLQDKRDNSFGIEGMKQRLASVNGTLKVESNHGTQLTISIPKDEKND